MNRAARTKATLRTGAEAPATGGRAVPGVTDAGVGATTTVPDGGGEPPDVAGPGTCPLVTTGGVAVLEEIVETGFEPRGGCDPDGAFGLPVEDEGPDATGLGLMGVRVADG